LIGNKKNRKPQKSIDTPHHTCKTRSRNGLVVGKNKISSNPVFQGAQQGKTWVPRSVPCRMRDSDQDKIGRALKEEMSPTSAEDLSDPVQISAGPNRPLWESNLRKDAEGRTQQVKSNGCETQQPAQQNKQRGAETRRAVKERPRSGSKISGVDEGE